MKKIICIALIAHCLALTVIAQNVGIGTTAPNKSAQLDVSSGNKGVLLPRMSSSARKAISSPATGLLVFDSTEKALYMYDGARWLGFSAVPDELRPVANFSFVPDPGDTLLAGAAVSIWGNFAAVGAPYTTVGSNVHAGAVYMYKLVNNSWQYAQTILPNAGNQPDTAFFGISIKVCGDYMVIGSPQNRNESGNRTGAAYIYHFNGTAWVRTSVIFGPATPDFLAFGDAVGINMSGTVCAIGDPSVNGGAGAIQVYNFNGAAWNFQTTLLADNPTAIDNFGTALALSPSGNYVLGSAYNRQVPGVGRIGYVGLYKNTGGAWSLFQTYATPSGLETFLGTHVDVTDNNAVFTTNRRVYAANIPADGQWNVSEPFYQYDTTTTLKNAAIDPANEMIYMWRDNNLYSYSAITGTTLLRTLSFDNVPFTTYTLSVQNKNYILGIPFQQRDTAHLAGAFYIGHNGN